MNRLLRVFTASLILLSLRAHAERPTAPDPMVKGPHAVETAEYKFPATIDREILPGKETELWARVFWPRGLSQKHPLLVLLHGNHPTCGAGSNPRTDADCTYTHEGKCPEGFVIVPNHEGYNYLGTHLASHGFVVVTVNANRGITCGDGVKGDSGLNLARGRLVLRHLQSLHKWATDGGAPESLGLGASGLVGKIDVTQVGLMGHSRGGEGMRAAYNLYLDRGSKWRQRIPGLDVKGIYEIGAVDGQTSRVLDADNTAWNQLLPMCDGDVSDLQGRLPYERMLLKRTEARKTPKSLYAVWGANHNFFNTEWQESDAFECLGHDPIHGKGPESDAQKKVALASMSAFFRAHVGAAPAPEMGLLFDPLALLPKSVASVTRIERDHVRTFDASIDLRVDDFDKATGKSSHGIPHLSAGIEIAHEQSIPTRAKIAWAAAGASHFLQVNWKAKGSGAALDPSSTVDFRVARDDSFVGNKVPTDFSVQLAAFGAGAMAGL